MDTQLFIASATTTLLLIASLLIARRWWKPQAAQAAKKLDEPTSANSLSETTVKLVQKLRSTFSKDVILPNDAEFDQSTACYWAQQECEMTPACVIRPHNSQQLSSIVTILKREFDAKGKAKAIFAIRSGGHSAVPGAASIKGGILIDLSRLCEVVLIEDEHGIRVKIGAGARWADVSKVLDSKGLAAVGGRNSHVGVGGLTLGGGLSFFSPKFGLACSNVIEYEIVLASGLITTASASTNLDLWKALKGGGNNFGIVTQFTSCCFPSTNIWAGFLYMPGFNSSEVVTGFYEAVSKANPNQPTFDSHAAGPIACFTYLQTLGIQIVSVSLVYTKPPDNSKWPSYWKTSRFASMWRLWSTCKARSLSSATDEMSSLNPPGRRQVQVGITVRNDAATLHMALAAYRNAVSRVRQIKGISWTLVMQPLMPQWARKGDPNLLGLDTSNPLVIVSFTVNWGSANDDEAVKSETRRTLEEIEAFAEKHNTAHPYRYLNYCAEWQQPFASYGEENWAFLKNVSRKYDPDGLFQRGCTGGHKLGIDGNAL